jgi:hypothetical protein
MSRNALVAVSIAALGVSAPALAVDFTVSPGQSIQDALDGASPGDRVLVQAGTYAELLTLVNGVDLLGGYDASFSDLTRDPQANPTVLTGSGTGTPVTSGAGIGTNTLVEGFVLTGAGGAPGAAILVIGGAPVFANNEIRGNRRVGATGGAYVQGGSFARFENNWFHDNSAGGSGGAMRIENSTAALVGNTFEDCVAPHTGGAVYAFQSAVGCTSNTFRSNAAGEGGGGVCLQASPVGASLVGNTFEDCSSIFGGGVWIKDDSFCDFEENDFDGCSADFGGGLASMNYSDITLLNNRFTDCTAAFSGGGVYARYSDIAVLGSDATSIASEAAFTNCSAGNGVNGTGGGIATQSTNGIIDRVRFTSCTGDSVGGGLYTLHSGFTITECVVEGCDALVEGGGFAITAAVQALLRESFLRNNTIYGCSAGDSDSAAGVLLAAMGSARVATLGGNIISHSLLGPSIRCRRGGTPAGTGLPTINCTTAHIDPSNPAVETVGGNRCQDAFTSGIGNQDGVDPLYCSPAPVDFTIQACSPAAGSNCGTGLPDRVDRGAAPDDSNCPCQTALSLEQKGWGQIKSMYR